MKSTSFIFAVIVGVPPLSFGQQQPTESASPDLRGPKPQLGPPWSISEQGRPPADAPNAVSVEPSPDHPLNLKIAPARRGLTGEDSVWAWIASGQLADAAKTLLTIADPVFYQQEPSVKAMEAAHELVIIYLAQKRFADMERMISLLLDKSQDRKDLFPWYRASLYQNRAVSYFLQGRFRESLREYERALPMLKDVLGEENGDIVTTYSNIGRLYEAIGDTHAAEQFLEDAVALARKLDEAPTTVPALLNLAVFQVDHDMTEKGSETLDEAETLCRIHMPDHQLLVIILSHKATLSNNPRTKEQAYLKLIEIIDNEFPELTGHKLSLYYNLGSLYSKFGQFDKGITYLRDALTLGETDAESSTLQAITSSLMLTLVRSGRSEEAHTLLKKFSDQFLNNATDVLSVTNEAQRLSYFRSTSPVELAAISRDSRTLADQVLKYKALVQDSLSEDLRLIKRAGDSERGNILLKKWYSIQSELQRLTLSKNSDYQGQTVSTLKSRLAESYRMLLEETGVESVARRKLETTAKDVSDALPEDFVLLEFVRYLDFLGLYDYTDIYGVSIIYGDESKEPLFVPLASSQHVHEQIEKYRNTIYHLIRTGRASDEEFLERAQSLYQLIWKPLKEENRLGKAKRVVISPDSQLHFLPFGALVNEEGGFALTEFDIQYVSSGSDLLRKPNLPEADHAKSPERVLLVGNPRFQEDVQMVAPGGEHQINQSLKANLRSGMSDDTRGLSFNPLPGTAEELSVVERILQKSGFEISVLTKEDASEAVVRDRCENAKILHFATHGFFLPAPSETSKGLKAPSNDLRATRGVVLERLQNPMYRSGLALSGAETTLRAWRRGKIPATEQDGILLAAEVAQLDLRNAELVTLSACSTGEGDALAGEGVLGLRRAFAVAGAETVVMSLWPVSDEATTKFMQNFFQHYLAGIHPAEAVSMTKREMLVEGKSVHGYLGSVFRYGPFVATRMGIEP